MLINLLNAFLITVRRELLLAFRQVNDLLQPLLFFIIVAALFPLAVSPEMNLLHTIGPGVIWVAALLATLLGLERLLRSDFNDGSLEQLALCPQPLALLLTAKVIAHWLLTGLPLIVMAPLLGSFFYLSGSEITTLMLSLLLGTPVLSLLGGVGMALTVSLRGGGVLLALLVLPLFIPVLIFGVSSVLSVGAGLSAAGELALLGAILVLALTLTPLASAAAVRTSLG